MPLPEHLIELDRRYRARLDRAVEALRDRFEERLRVSSDELTRALRSEAAEWPAGELLDDVEFARLEEAPRRAGERATFAALHDAMVAFDRADSQGALLEALLAAARRFVPRAGLLLTRTEGIVGWGGVGFGDPGDPLAGRESEWSGVALAALARGRGCVIARGADAVELAARFELPSAEVVALVPLVLRDTVAAALYVDRRAGEEELPLAGLQLLALGAAQRLELQALSHRTRTPTLFLDEAGVDSGLGLWSSTTVALPAVASPAALPRPEPPAEIAEEALAAAPRRLESTGVEELFSLSGDAEVALESPAEEPADWAPVPVADPAAYEPERTFEIEAELLAPAGTEVGPSPEPVGEPVFELEPDLAPLPPEAPETVTAALSAGAAEPTLEPEVVAEAESEVALAPEPALELGWEMEDADATVFQPDFASSEVEPIGAASISPLEPPAADTRDLPLPSGATWSVLSPSESIAPESLPPGLETRALPIAPIPGLEPTEDATQMISRAPATPPALEASEDATVLVTRSETPQVAALAEDATELVQRPTAPPAPPLSEPTEEPTHPGLPARPATDEEPGERTQSRAARGTEVVPPPDLQGPGLAFTTGRIQRATGENALHEEARRLARLLISEIKLYNEEQVEEGRRHRDLYLRLKEDIDRSRQIYDERVHDSVRGTSDYFQQELIRSLAGGDSRALGI